MFCLSVWIKVNAINNELGETIEEGITKNYFKRIIDETVV